MSIHTIADLKHYPQWVCFTLDKKPINPHTGYGADCNDSSTWSTYEFARLAARDRHLAGIGYEFSKEQNVTGIDLDHCIDENGNVSLYAQEIVTRLNSYTEYSPSKSGLHIWVRGSIPDNIDSDIKADGKNRVEMYDCKRYFTITDQHLSGTPETFEDRQEVLLVIHQETVTRRRAAKEKIRQSAKREQVSTQTGNSRYGLKALAAECQDLATTPDGGRNAQLNRASFAMGQLVAGGELTRATVEQLLTDAAARAGLGESEIEKTMRSGLESGMQSPRSAPKTDAPISKNYSSTDLCSFDADDSGNGDAVYAVYGASFLFCSAYGWLCYTGTHWKRMSDDSAIKQSVVNVLRERRHAAIDAKQESIVKCTIASSKNVNGAIDRFKSLVSVAVDVFDNEPNLFNAQDCVVDLRTGETTPHHPDQRFTWCAPVPYSYADTTLWLKQLNETVGGGQEMIDYLQLALGYSLTGHTSEECLFYLYGPSRSGKGTLAEAISALLPSPLAESLDFTSLTAKRSEDTNNFDFARLKPSRIVFASESNRSQSLNASKIKGITGGDNITTSFKHRDAFTYRPQFKLWMLSNWPVNGDPEDNALWGRVRIIEFPHSFLGQEDKSKKSALKHPDSLQAILYWCIQGAIKWYALGAQGLSIPAKVADATKAQRDELDFIAQWLTDCTEPGEWISNVDINASYQTWCEENHVSAKKARSFALSLQIKGYKTGIQKKIEGKNCKGVAGLQLKTIDPDDPEGNGLSNGNGSNGENTINSLTYKETENHRNDPLQALPVTNPLPVTEQWKEISIRESQEKIRLAEEQARIATRQKLRSGVQG